MEDEDWKRPFQKGDMKHKLLEESSFAILFPRYRERYLTENTSKIEQVLNEFGIAFRLDVRNNVISVHTTDDTWDPVAILKARDLIKLLARSVPIEKAKEVMQDDKQADVIIIGKDIRNKERFVKRRQRLIGPNSSTLKALELLTECYILVHGHSVAVIGSTEGINTVRKVVDDCMNNIHPVYHIKTLMIKRELRKNPEMADKDWSKYLPKLKSSTHSKRKPVKHRETGGIPDYPVDSKIDKEIESGEYFLKKKTNEKKHKKKEAKELRKAEEQDARTEQDLKVKTEVPEVRTADSAADIAQRLAEKANE